MNYFKITREDERQINRNFDNIIAALEASELVINRDFFDDIQQKIEKHTTLKREKDEQMKQFVERYKREQKENMQSYLSGYIDAQLTAKYSDIFDGISFPHRFYIMDCVAEFIIDFFAENKIDYEAKIERRLYNRWYAKNVRRAKDKEDLRNANENAT